MLSFQFNWYTKRASLAGVYKSTEIYMLQDKSEDFQNTWEFLNRRMGDLKNFGKFARSVRMNFFIFIKIAFFCQCRLESTFQSVSPSVHAFSLLGLMDRHEIWYCGHHHVRCTSSNHRALLVIPLFDLQLNCSVWPNIVSTDNLTFFIGSLCNLVSIVIIRRYTCLQLQSTFLQLFLLQILPVNSCYRYCLLTVVAVFVLQLNS